MRRVLGIGIVTLLLVAACSQPTPTAVPAPTATAAVAPTQVPAAVVTSAPVASQGVQLPEVDPATVTGAIVTAGSSTVYPLSEAIAEMFKDEGYADNITIDSIGSGAGFERFCETGEIDVANASRPIKSSEIEACGAIDRDVLEFRVGTDALAIVVSKENDFLTDVTMEQLAKIFSAAYVKWSDVDPTWPAQDILRFSPGTDSGTFDYFVEEVLGKEKALLLDAPNLQLSEDDNVLVQGVLGSPYAIGYFGYAYYGENADTLTALSVEGITPSAETVDAATYPLARPLFIYTSRGILAEKPQVAAYINFYLTNVNAIVERVGYFAASDEAMDASKSLWLEAMGQ